MEPGVSRFGDFLLMHILQRFIHPPKMTIKFNKKKIYFVFNCNENSF